jgi:hypothetical protein
MINTLEQTRGRSLVKHLSFLVAAVLIAGCGDDVPTNPRSTPPAATATTLPDATVLGPAAAQLAIDDAVDRIIPTLSDAASAGQLAAALSELQHALDAGRVADGPTLARVTQAEVERYARLQPGDAAALDAVRLALAVVIGLT